VSLTRKPYNSSIVQFNAAARAVAVAAEALTRDDAIPDKHRKKFAHGIILARLLGREVDLIATRDAAQPSLSRMEERMLESIKFLPEIT